MVMDQISDAFHTLLKAPQHAPAQLAQTLRLQAWQDLLGNGPPGTAQEPDP